MLKNLFKIAVVFPKILTSTQRRTPLIRSLGFSFSSKHHQQNLKKILSEVNEKNLDEILIKLGDFDKTHKQIGLKIILDKLQEKKLPFSTLINQKFLQQVSHFPEICIDTHLLHIRILTNYLDSLIFNEEGEKEEVIRTTLEEISQAFDQCFKVYEQIEKGEKSIKYELKLGKLYTNFFLYHSNRFIKGKEREQGLKKCCQILRTIISLETNLIKEELRRMQDVEHRQIEGDDSKETKQRVMEDIRHHTLNIIDLFSENVINLSESIGQLASYHLDKKQSADGILQAIKNYESALEFYSLVGQQKRQSKYFFQIRINKAELVLRQQSSTLRKEDPTSKDKYKELKETMFKELDSIYREAHECLNHLINKKGKGNIVKEIAMTIMTVRMDQEQRKEEVDLLKIEESLVEESKNILSKIKENKLKDSVEKELMTYCKGVVSYLKMLVKQKKKQGAKKSP